LRQLDEAEGMLREAVVMNDRLGFRSNLAAAYGNLGRVLLDKGNVGESEMALRNALDIHSQLDDSSGMVEDYSNLGQLFERRGLHAEAREFYLRMLDMANSTTSATFVTEANTRLKALTTPPSGNGDPTPSIDDAPSEAS
jgi:tetratricopeptide (TPR) repeat protein